jgi:hypothetical protein
MTFEKLWNILEKEVPNKIKQHDGLNFFIKNRAKFEGWFKVELCDILSKQTKNIIPEKDRIDIVFDDWALELKTINTNYRYPNIENRTRPITKNIKGIIKDIDCLMENDIYSKKSVIFIAFPLSLSTHSKYWKEHIIKIEKKLKRLEYTELNFSNGSAAVLYCGLIAKNA